MIKLWSGVLNKAVGKTLGRPKINGLLIVVLWDYVILITFQWPFSFLFSHLHITNTKPRFNIAFQQVIPNLVNLTIVTKSLKDKSERYQIQIYIRRKLIKRDIFLSYFLWNGFFSFRYWVCDFHGWLKPSVINHLLIGLWIFKVKSCLKLKLCDWSGNQLPQIFN